MEEKREHLQLLIKKVYFNIIDESSDERLRIWEAGEMYVLRGRYIFEYVENDTK